MNLDLGHHNAYDMYFRNFTNNKTLYMHFICLLQIKEAHIMTWQMAVNHVLIMFVYIICCLILCCVLEM